ncbi:MAG: fructose-6-phosphate aldolase [Bacteroidetes bacterium SW_11_45_7]|nr:MAG: fructose-6-phosphate aldolase [Bacteroidetes bacterium SW_11_45_7]
MKFFVDTANIDQIQEARALGILDGVTTNPSLMAKEGITGQDNIYEHYANICDIVNGPVSAEVISTDFDGIVQEGRELASIRSNIYVKVPMIKEGVKAIKQLSDEGIRINCTLVFSSAQALLAAKAGAAIVSPFIGRVDDTGHDGVQLIEQIVQIFDTYGYETEVLAASVRSPLHIPQTAQAGADIATCPFQTINDLFYHPLTDIGLEKFLNDYKKVNG